MPKPVTMTHTLRVEPRTWGLRCMLNTRTGDSFSNCCFSRASCNAACTQLLNTVEFVQHSITMVMSIALR